LEQYFNQVLKEHLRQIIAESGVTEEEHQLQTARAAARNPIRHALEMAREHHDIRPLKEVVKNALGSEVLAFVQLPKRQRKRSQKGTLRNLDSKPHLKAKTEAVWEARRALAIKKHIGFVGYEPRTHWKVAAARAGVTIGEAMDWEKQTDCPPDPWPIIFGQTVPDL
jgi:hypothetical protein